jgi:hypothetical protein
LKRWKKRYSFCFVAAIDFGTTYSGYAFSSRDDFKKDPLKIVANQAWNAGSQRHFSLKTPTCLLLDDKEELVSFVLLKINSIRSLAYNPQIYVYFFRSPTLLRANERCDFNQIA